MQWYASQIPDHPFGLRGSGKIPTWALSRTVQCLDHWFFIHQSMTCFHLLTILWERLPQLCVYVDGNVPVELQTQKKQHCKLEHFWVSIDYSFERDLLFTTGMQPLHWTLQFPSECVCACVCNAWVNLHVLTLILIGLFVYVGPEQASYKLIRTTWSESDCIELDRCDKCFLVI